MKNHIEERRKARGMTQQQLASELGVSRQTIISLENGKYNPSILLAHKWSRPRLRDQIIRNYEEEGEPDGLFAVESYRKRAQEGRLPKPIDPLHRIADFSEDGYGAMRFTL